MGLLMARCAKGDQILGRVIAQSAPQLNVMDLKVFHLCHEQNQSPVTFFSTTEQAAELGEHVCVSAEIDSDIGIGRLSFREIRQSGCSSLSPKNCYIGISSLRAHFSSVSTAGIVCQLSTGKTCT